MEVILESARTGVLRALIEKAASIHIHEDQVVQVGVLFLSAFTWTDQTSRLSAQDSV
jgi:hypothetical protein